MRQAELFSENHDGVEVINDHLHVSKSTFIGGLSAHVHRWFRLTPSFGPELVCYALKEMSTPAGATILDPFAGAGTTLIEAKLSGFSAYGFEINPFLHWVCENCLEWLHGTSSLRAELHHIQDEFAIQRRKNGALEDLGLTLPPIHNVARWWRPDVLRDLVILLDTIRRRSSSNHKRARFFELALAGVLVPNLTNVTLGRLQLCFVNKDDKNMDVWREFSQHATLMLDDLDHLHELKAVGNALVYLTDSTTLEGVPTLNPIDRVVTSPPYPNRYSYIWNTRPHLYLFGLIKTAKEASAIDLRTIGGTWGTATSILMKGRINPAFPIIRDVVEPVVEQIRAEDNLMANYLMKYFNLLAHQIVKQHSLLAPDAKMAYVVGCSRLRGQYVATDLLLAKVFEGLGLGYRVTNVTRFRKRHSDKDLHESIVFAERT